MPPLAISDLDPVSRLAITELAPAIASLPTPSARLAPPRITSDDDLLADLLISMWALASGRFLRRGVRPEQLSKEELIEFWADDLTPALGRHAAAQAPQSPKGPARTGSTLAAR
jgi:hypothetical protein